MRKSDVFPYYRKCCSELANVYEYLKSLFQDNFADELCSLRGYTEGEQKELIKAMKIGCCDIADSTELGDMRKELGLVSDKDNFLLANRFIIPVEGMDGNLLALIGYYPDQRKYITTPAPFFSKECLFFNYKQAYELSWKEYGGFVILVEGIFDCLSLRAIGLPCIATMGASVSRVKGELLYNFRKVLCIPDDDKTGHKSLDRFSSRGWQVPSSATFLRFHGGIVEFDEGSVKCKDMDNFVSWFNADDVREILLSYRDSKEDIEDFYL